MAENETETHWDARAAEDGKHWEVINADEEVVAVHEPPNAEEKAREQVELLNEIEKELDEKPYDDDGE